MRKTATKLTEVKNRDEGKGGSRKKQTFWCVSWPRIGKVAIGNSSKQKRAETVLQQKLIEQENTVSLASRLTSATRRVIWNAPNYSSRSAQQFGTPVNSYIPH